MSSKPIKHLAKETLFVGLALICMFAMVIITSIGSAGLDPAKIFSKGNVANLLINASITLFGIIATIPSGRVDTKQRVNPDGSNGKYLQDFHAYNKIRKLIEPLRSKFSQWHHAQFLKELRDKQVSYLLSFNILQAEDILKLSREQVLQLTTSQAFLIDNETVYFKSLSDRQIFECLRVLNGEVTVHKLPDFYFLYIDGKRKRSFYDQAYYEAQDENLSLTFKIIYKVFIGFVITCIFTGLVVDAVVVEGITPAWVLHTMLLI